MRSTAFAGVFGAWALLVLAVGAGALARMEAVQLFRRSVALRQKELLENSLRSLETYALTSRSATSEEASLRVREGQQILDFIDRARQLQPRGQVILAGGTAAGETLMEDGDVIRVPEISSVVQVSGEVLLPNALAKPIDSDCGLVFRRSSKSCGVLIGESAFTANTM